MVLPKTRAEQAAGIVSPHNNVLNPPFTDWLLQPNRHETDLVAPSSPPPLRGFQTLHQGNFWLLRHKALFGACDRTTTGFKPTQLSLRLDTVGRINPTKAKLCHENRQRAPAALHHPPACVETHGSDARCLAPLCKMPGLNKTCAAVSNAFYSYIRR
jgi:hypothetical protein